MRVTAKQDIVTGRGFPVARSGDAGKIVKPSSRPKPHNMGKVLVLFGDRRHGYWVDPTELAFKGDVSRFVVEIEPERAPVCLPSSVTPKPNFGANLRAIRRARGMSQAVLADKVGVAQSAISYRERQSGCPSGSFLSTVASVLNVPAFTFFVCLDCADLGLAREFIGRVSSSVCER